MEPTNNSNFGALMNEAKNNLNVLNSIKTVLGNYLAEEAPDSSKMEKDDYVTAIKDFSTKTVNVTFELEKLFSTEFELQPGQVHLKSYVDAKDVYFNSTKEYATNINEFNPDITSEVNKFAESTKAFTEVLNDAIEELGTEISNLTGKVREAGEKERVANVITEQTNIISNEHENVLIAFEAVL